MATRQAYKRLTREYKNLEASPVPYITARPDESNILIWHYIIDGPPDTPYQGGQYHGTLTFPADYPFKPPAIRMFTPSGRFQPGMRLCLSISDYHPKTWNPAWSASTILTGLLSFMVSDEVTAGSIAGTTEKRKQLAKASRTFNNQSTEFKIQFPDIVKKNVEYMINKSNSPQEDDEEDGNKDKDAQALPASSNSRLKKITLNASINTNSNNTTIANRDEELPIDQKSENANNKNVNNNNTKNGMSLTNKMICAAVLLVSWVVASRLFS